MTTLLRRSAYLTISIVYFAAISIATRLVTFAFLIQRASEYPLPDIILEGGGRIGSAFEVTEMIIASMIVAMCVIVVTTPVQDEAGSLLDHCMIVATRYIIISSTALSFRIICICVTTLPVPIAADAVKCRALVAMPFIERLMSVYTCGDYMYSGHAAATMVPGYFIIYHTSSYVPHKRWIIATCVAVLCIVSLSGIIVSGEHYTVDVLIGAYVGVTLCDVYHKWFV